MSRRPDSKAYLDSQLIEIHFDMLSIIETLKDSSDINLTLEGPSGTVIFSSYEKKDINKSHIIVQVGEDYIPLTKDKYGWHGISLVRSNIDEENKPNYEWIFNFVNEYKTNYRPQLLEKVFKLRNCTGSYNGYYSPNAYFGKLEEDYQNCKGNFFMYHNRYIRRLEMPRFMQKLKDVDFEYKLYLEKESKTLPSPKKADSTIFANNITSADDIKIKITKSNGVASGILTIGEKTLCFQTTGNIEVEYNKQKIKTL